MSTNLVLREDRGSIAILTLNRPDKRNALSQALVAELRDALELIKVDERIRVVVLTGAGSAFSSGMDMKEAGTGAGAPESERATIAVLEQFADLIQYLHTLPKPTIAAVNGDALAGVAGLLAACDLAVAAATARIGYPEVKRGLVPSIVLHDLSRQVGDRRCRQLVLGGEMISAQTAADWGIVNLVTPAESCLSEALRMGNELVSSAPQAIATTKQLLDLAAARPHDLRGAAAESAAARVSDEAQEGIRAFLEKRPPAWAKPGPQWAK
jgi:methylglutaconyl-CoA hydratase